MNSYTEVLRHKAAETGSIVCLGMDPVIEKIPIKEQSPEKRIVKFYSDILAATNSLIGAAKPNYAFYAQYGFPGLRALKKVITACKGYKIPVILDAKRADIGKTSEAYAKEAFEFWKADALTVQPYMGMDSVQPFMEYCKKGKGVYLLVRTSNKGAADFQEKGMDGKPFYMRLAEKTAEWHQPGTGAVVGATNIEELREIAGYFNDSGKEIPLLIPGVGSQGGNAADTAKALTNHMIHRINSSSGINYAYEKYRTENYAEAAVKAVRELNSEISF